MTLAGTPDSTAQAALDADVRQLVSYVFLDIDGEPQRVTDGPYSVLMAGTGDEDLDGFLFTAVDATVVSISDVHQKEGGGDTVTCQLSALAGIDDDLKTAIGNKAKWQGRDARIWRQMRDPDTLAPIGALWHDHTGVMSAPRSDTDASSGLITLEIESYTAFYSRASNRTLLSQTDFDPGDQSAALSIASANGVTAAGNPLGIYAGGGASNAGTANY